MKASEGLIARPHDQSDRGEAPGQRPSERLIDSRHLSVLLPVMWTRCGREPKPADRARTVRTIGAGQKLNLDQGSEEAEKGNRGDQNLRSGLTQIVPSLDGDGQSDE